MLTLARKRNLLKLARYLEKLPTTYAQFDMENFAVAPNGYLDPSEVKPDCGTVACAAGHGPIAGVKPLKHETWFEYIERQFGVADNSPEFIWMFAISWIVRDKTPHGAAKRIFHYVKHGVPDDFIEQMTGDVPLCYQPA